MFGRKRERDPIDTPAPGEQETAKTMGALAAAFVRGAAEEGQPVDFSPESAARIDLLAGLFMATHRGHPPAPLLHSMTMSMGAFLGELIVRNGGGSWVYDDVQNTAAVQLSSSLRCFPLNTVSKRLTIGPQHSLEQFYETAMTGTLPPGARRIN